MNLYEVTSSTRVEIVEFKLSLKVPACKSQWYISSAHFLDLNPAIRAFTKTARRSAWVRSLNGPTPVGRTVQSDDSYVVLQRLMNS